jgi:hypothetical protein
MGILLRRRIRIGQGCDTDNIVITHRKILLGFRILPCFYSMIYENLLYLIA